MISTGETKSVRKKLLSDICPTFDLTWIGLELIPALRYKGRRLSWAMAHPFLLLIELERNFCDSLIINFTSFVKWADYLPVSTVDPADQYIVAVNLAHLII
jgi:hypothetical protein